MDGYCGNCNRLVELTLTGELIEHTRYAVVAQGGGFKPVTCAWSGCEPTTPTPATGPEWGNEE